jgi:hypothetical protein
LEEQRHAEDLLDAVVQFGDAAGVELYPTDNFKVLEQVFRQYMRAYDYYRLPPETQERVSNVYKQIIAFLNPAQALQGIPAAAIPSSEDPFAEATQGMTDNLQGQAMAEDLAAQAAQFEGGGTPFIPEG